MKIIDETQPWQYGLYSSTIVRFDLKQAEILKRDTLTWEKIDSLVLYRRLTEECDLISTKEAQELIQALQEKKPTYLD